MIRGVYCLYKIYDRREKIIRSIPKYQILTRLIDDINLLFFPNNF
jgi:hypothetical protein